MKPLFHSFAFFHREHGPITVEFTHDERGKPDEVRVQMLGQTFTIDNSHGKYRPCVTHCNVVVDYILPKKKPKAIPKKARRRTTKPRQKALSNWKLEK